MDAGSLIILRTDVYAQMAVIKDVHHAMLDRAQALDPNDLRQLESVAYQIHNLYNAIEDLLKLIAAHFENQIADAERWHSALLRRMAQPIPGVRPAFLTQESATVLDALRGFRHFFRHAYVATIEYDQLVINLNKAQRVHELLRQDVEQFLAALGSAVQ
jgi:hypothetical protein